MELYRSQFESASKGSGYVSGKESKAILTASGLPKPVLHKLWDLADIDKDGQLDIYEFVIIMYLSDAVRGGIEVPQCLEADMIPAHKR